jgi:CrcB protein
MLQTLLVAGFGIFGVLARYGIDVLFSGSTSSWPMSTFLINLSGSFLAGVAYGACIEKGLLAPELRAGIMTGFLGGYTTFSAYALQGARLLAAAPGIAIAYLALSPVIGVFFAWLGLLLIRSM